MRNHTGFFTNRTNKKPVMELLVIFVLASAVFALSSKYDFLEKLVELMHKYEHLELDEIISVFLFFGIALIFFSVRRWKEAIHVNNRLRHKNRALRDALNEVKQLRGILPICTSCKNIRDDVGYWHQVEAYIGNHSSAEFSHGISPECIKKTLSGVYRR